MSRRRAAGVLGALLLATSLASANDGVPDSNNRFPAVGFYFVASSRPGGPLNAESYCSGTLIAEDLFLTAAHCTFRDTRRFVEPLVYQSAEAWVSFDPIAQDNDFRCFLIEGGYPGSKFLPCDQGTRHHPTFHKARSTGITHPEYPMLRRLGDGTLVIQELFRTPNTDLGVLVLEEPIAGTAPLPTAPLGLLGQVDRSGLAALGVGYGLNYHKSIPADPDQPHGAGPTNFLGDYGIRRIADLGKIRTITGDQVVPTQRSARGEDSVCDRDAGSPLFLVEDGVVDATVVGVLTGGAGWCQGDHDPYQRVDTPSTVAFLDCVRDAPTMRAACACGVEETLGLCEGF